MKYIVCTIYDVKTATHSVPYCFLTKGAALREFVTLASDTSSRVSKYPTDFAMMEIGVFDDATALMTPLSAPINYGLANDYLVSVVNSDRSVTKVENDL